MLPVVIYQVVVVGIYLQKYPNHYLQWRILPMLCFGWLQVKSRQLD